MSHTLVIGGGIIGLLTARELALAGTRVTLVERGETGRQSSWAGGGIISPLYPWRYPDAVTALSHWSQRAYPKLCTTLTEETGIDPELIRSGMLILDQGEQDQALSWGKEHDAQIELLESDSLGETEPSLGPRPPSALWMPEIAQVRNPRLAKALRRAIETQVSIRENEEVVELLVGSGRALGARTTQATLEADQIVVCAGAWTAKLFQQLDKRPDIQPVRGQMILFYAKPGDINHVVLSGDRYVIPRKDGRVLVGSTLEHEGFIHATTAEAKEELHRTAVEMFPLLQHTPIESHWAGLRPGSPNGIPYIGGYPGVQGLYFNAGHYRNGLVTSPASARLVADLVLGRDPITDPAPYALDADR